MIFSQRYHRALRDGRLDVDLDTDVRRKLWAQLLKHDASFGVQRDPNDRVGSEHDDCRRPLDACPLYDRANASRGSMS